MNIAELFVRVRGDTTDVTKKLKGVEGSLAGVGRAAGNVPIPMNRMNTALRVMAQQATGVSGPVGSLLTTIGGFAMTGPYIAAALIGIAALAKAYDLLTRSTRQAREEQDRLVKGGIARFAPKTGPDSEADKEYQALLRKRAALTKELMSIPEWKPDPLGVRGKLETELKAVRLAIDTAQTSAITMLDTVSVKSGKAGEAVKGLTTKFGELRDAIADVRRESEQEGMAFWRNLANAKADVAERNAWLEPDISTNVTGEGIHDMMGLTQEQIEAIEEGKREARQNADIIRSAVLQSAQIIVGALNIGGGGKGSNLGGALGGTAGFAAGMWLTGGSPIGGAVGSTIGNILGSAIGGLFDSNKKAINRNTEATNRNTMALLANAPSGYKTDRGRFDATQIKEMREATRRYLTRGGAPVFVGAT